MGTILWSSLTKSTQTWASLLSDPSLRRSASSLPSKPNSGIDPPPPQSKDSVVGTIILMPRFALVRLGLLLEEEKLQEQNRLEAGYERVRQFKDSMGKRYSNASEDMNSIDGSDCDETLGSSDGSFSADLNEGTNTPESTSRTSRVGSFEENEGYAEPCGQLWFMGKTCNSSHYCFSGP